MKKEAKLSASEMPGEVVGSGEEDLRCRSLLTVCQRRLGLSEAEDTRLVQLMPLHPKTPCLVEIQTGFTVLEKRPLNRCSSSSSSLVCTI